METSLTMKKIYMDIQEKLYYMIPEKWDSIFLYASIFEGIQNLETGEMFFYYFPKGILRKEPVNVYEIPNKFNIEEDEYLKLTDELYEKIKKLKEEFVRVNKKNWTNITISIQNYRFMVEYDYEDLKTCEFMIATWLKIIPRTPTKKIAIQVAVFAIRYLVFCACCFFTTSSCTFAFGLTLRCVSNRSKS